MEEDRFLPYVLGVSFHFLNLCEHICSHYERTQCVHMHSHCDCTSFTAVVPTGHECKSYPSLCQACSYEGVKYAQIPGPLACEAKIAEKLYSVDVSTVLTL